jgi:hypothetical protein
MVSASQSISSVIAVNPLVAFYNILGRKTRDAIILLYFDGRLVQRSEIQTTKPEVPGSNPGSGRGFCE